METWQKKQITANLPELIKITECDDFFLSHFLSNEIFSFADIMKLKCIVNMHQRNMEFYMLIQTRSNDSYKVLIESLEEGNQSVAADILREGYSTRGSQPSVSTGRNVNQIAPPRILRVPSINLVPATPPLQPSPLAAMAAGRNEVAHDNVSGSDSSGGDVIDFRNNMAELKVAVIKPVTPMEFMDDSYRLREDFKGFALVLNITKFDNEAQNRRGATLDTKYMKNLWQQLGYKVTTIEGYVSLKKFKENLESFKNQFTPESTAQSCVVFLGSHGSFSRIHSSDNGEIDLYQDVIYKFDLNQCPQLQKKPKMFFLQACQRFQTDCVANRTKMDALLKTPIDDTIVCFSTIPGYVANRDVILGTWYSYCLAKVFMENAHHMDLIKLLKKTQETMKNIDAEAPQGQLSTFLDLGIKTVYFNMLP